MEHRSQGTTGVSSSKMPQPMTRINGLPAHTKGYCKYPTYKTPWWTGLACSAAMAGAALPQERACRACPGKAPCS